MYVNALGKTVIESGISQDWIKSLTGGLTTIGAALNDAFDVNAGNIIAGGKGDDSYTLWGSGGQIVEKAGEGVDSVHVQFWGGYTLGANLENLYLDGPDSTWGTGNALDNLLVAGTHGATLDGGAGNDVLVGGAGADVFNVTAGNGSDAIYNFQSGWDTISLKGYGLKSFADLLSHAKQTGSDVTISMANGENLLLRGVTLSSLTAGDFGFSTVNTTTVGTAALAATSLTTMTGVAQAYKANGVTVLNNVWGTSGLTYNTDYAVNSVFNAKNPSSGVTFNWAFPNSTDVLPQIRAYPEIMFGKSPLGIVDPTDTGHAFPVKVSDIQNLTSSFSTAIGGTKSGFDVAYDIWFTNTPYGDASSVTNEVMVWTHKGVFDAQGTLVGTFSNGGLTGKIYHSGTYTAVVLDHDVAAGTIDLSALFKTLQGLGILSGSEYLDSVQYGAEVASGTGSLTINNFNITLTTGDGAGGTIVKQIDGTGTTTTAHSATTSKVTAAMTAAYDAHGLLTGYTTIDKDASGSPRTNHFDTGGNLLSSDVVTTSGGTVTKHYDATGKLTGSDTQSGTTVTHRDGSGVTTGIDTVNASNGTTTTTHYTNNWVLTGADSVQVTSSGTMVQHFDANWHFTGSDFTASYAKDTSVTWHYDQNWKTVSIDQTSTANGVVTSTHADAGNVMLSGAKDWVDGNGIQIHQDFDKKWALLDTVFTGTAGNDKITLSAGTNQVHGGLGSDTIVASGGADTFVFDTAIGKDVDTIQNFAVKQDVLQLDHRVFGGIGSSGTLAASLFAVGTAATSASTRIVYDSSTGNIYYDADGSGSKAAVLFGHVDAHLALTASNFHVG